MNHRFIHLFALLSITTSIVSCQKESFLVGGNENVNLEKDNNYIHFCTGIETRGALVEEEDNVLKDDFAVLGYKYRGEWKDANIFTVPNVFYDGEDVKLPLHVEYKDEDGIFTYDDPEVWTGNNYAFFGYYPYINDENSPIKLFDSNNVRAGHPYITYTLPSLTDPSKMIDLMTAAKKDTKFGEETEVTMNMFHRLSALDIGVYNYSEHVIGKDSQGKDITEDVTLEIIGCNIKFNVVNSAKIYLDNSIETEYATTSFATTNISLEEWWNWEDAFTVAPTGDKISYMTSSPETTLLLIPQREHLSGKINLKYKKKYKIDGNSTESWEYILSPNNTPVFETGDLDINFNKELVEGLHYYIEVIFTSNAITVQGTVANDWVEKEVKHEFE